ncbi:MAG TPA: hypothetical protein VI893_03530, partial [Thermoplasmata archaeon]|nr:hypothetical protein [Thermoplasmata archaeon]
MGRSVFVVVVASLLLLPAGVSLASAAAAEGLPDGSPSGEARDPRYDRISLIHGSFDPLVAGLPVAAGFSAPAATDSRYVFVQLTGPVRPEWRAAVESIG